MTTHSQHPGDPASPAALSPAFQSAGTASRKPARRTDAALYWYAFGLSVIPLASDSKVTAVKWDGWLAELSIDAINRHYEQHPRHDVGAILGDRLIVLDADDAQSVAALEALEREHNVTPRLVVRTRKGFHHYLARAAGTFARSDAHSTEKHPERIDVKTGRALVVLPPSGGREVAACDAASVDDLTEATQAFIDAVFAHNGRKAPRPYVGQVARADEPPSSMRMAQVAALLDGIDPDCGYADWLAALMAVFHASGGSDAGFELVAAWSSRGSKFKGRAEIEAKWRSFRVDVATPHTIATLVHLAKKCGADPADVLDAAEPQFEICDFEVVDKQTAKPPPRSPHPLDRYSLRDRADAVQGQLVEQKHVLGEIALSGQATAIYAEPNTGKTLMTIALLAEAIREGRVEPGRVYYVNVDDTTRGLLEKLRVADEFRFHMLAEGYQEFRARSLMEVVAELTAGEHARGTVVVLDTMKKFVNLM